MPQRFQIALKRLKLNSCFLRHIVKYSTTQLLNHPQKQQSSIEQLSLYKHLLGICLRECKNVQSRQLLDQMPQRLGFSLSTVKGVHCQGLKLGIASHGKLGYCILDFYAKCCLPDYAENMFLQLQETDELAWNSIMVMNSRRGLFSKVVANFQSMWSCGWVGNQFSCAVVLSACAKMAEVEFGKQLHCIIVKLGHEANAYCEGSLIDMYAKCGHFDAAKGIFECAVNPDTVSWTALISGFAQAGFIDEAMHVFEDMREAGLIPDQVVYVTMLNACVRQGRLEDACRLFSQMPNPNIVAWNVMISGHSKSGNEGDAIALFKDMNKASIKPTRSTLGSVLSAIASLGDSDYGLQVHACAMKLGLDTNIYAGSSLINMYAKGQNMRAAKAVFDGLEEENDVIWNALLGGYAQNGHARDVLDLFANMKLSGFQSDEYTYTSVLSACACLGNVETGRQLHSHIIKNEFIRANLYVQNALVDMYAKCGALAKATTLFEQINKPDHVSWNAIIVGYVQENEEVEAFRLFQKMMSKGIAPDEVSLASILSATGSLQELSIGQQLHCFLVKYGLEQSLYAGSSLVDMYCKCGMVESATQVFSCMPEKSVVCINALISGRAKSSLDFAVSFFKDMLHDGFKPSEVTFATLLEACSDSTNLCFGVQIHCFIVKRGHSYHDEFLAVSLLGMYMSAQRDIDAIRYFSELPDPKSAVLWTVLISGSIRNDRSEDGLTWYQEMRHHNILPDQATFASILSACSSLASLDDGKKIHSLIFHIAYDKDELTGSTLVDMYAKCGDMGSSARVFSEMTSKRDVISWNSIIVGYAKNGFAENALKIFDQMKQSGIKPDEVTFLGVLTACSHAGKVSEGREIYGDMSDHYGINPRLDHLACMVDLYGRWGSLDEAEEFIDGLNIEPDSKVWATYLSACRLHGDEIRGQRAAHKLIEMEPNNSSHYVLLSHLHAASGNWDVVDNVRKKMTEKRVRKSAGSSRIPSIL